jgi:hypothetical protein
MNQNVTSSADLEDDILNQEAPDEAVESAGLGLEGQPKSMPTVWPCVTLTFCDT